MAHRVPRSRITWAGWVIAAVLCGLAASGARHAAAAAGEGDTLTIPQCIALALQRAPDVRAATAEQAAALADSVATSYNRLPTFAMEGGATVAPQGFYDPAITNLGEYQLKLAAELPVLDGGRRARARALAGLEAAGARADLAARAREAALRVATVAADVLRHEENASSQGASLAWIERLGTVVESGVRAGARGRADAARVMVERAAVASALLVTRDAGAALGRELAELVGRAITAPPAIAEPGPETDQAPESADSARVVAQALARPEVRLALVEEQRQRVALAETRRRNALELGLAADAGLAGTDLTRIVPDELRATDPDATVADRLRRDLGASVSVNLRRPLADRGVRPSMTAREEGLRAASLARTAAEARAQRDALDRVGHWRAAAGRAAVAVDAAVRADENLLRLRALYVGGNVGLLDLLDARRQLDDARERLADARFDVREARYQAEVP
jgi:outer membrane protein TolC